jgi:hypothetical protein
LVACDCVSSARVFKAFSPCGDGIAVRSLRETKAFTRRAACAALSRRLLLSAPRRLKTSR